MQRKTLQALSRTPEPEDPDDFGVRSRSPGLPGRSYRFSEVTATQAVSLEAPRYSIGRFTVSIHT